MGDNGDDNPDGGEPATKEDVNSLRETIGGLKERLRGDGGNEEESSTEDNEESGEDTPEYATADDVSELKEQVSELSDQLDTDYSGRLGGEKEESSENETSQQSNTYEGGLLTRNIEDD